MRWAEYVVRIRDLRNILIGRPEGGKPPEKPRSRWEINIRLDLREVGWEVVGWIHLAQDKDQWRAVVNMLMNFGVP
jgi:hypothetical protein